MLGPGYSSHRIRRLCETGVVPAEMTDANRWQIADSAAEGLVEYVRREGSLPPIPQAGPSPAIHRRSNPKQDREYERGDPKPEPTVSPEVRAEADSVAIAEKRLERLRLELDTEQVEDAFREREKRMLAEQEEKRRAEAKEQAARAKKKWWDRWERWALSLLPYDAPPDCKLEAHKEIQRTLNDLHPDQSEEIVRELLKAAVSKAQAPYLRQQQMRQQMQAAVDSAVSSIPYRPLVWTDESKARVRQVANDAVLETARKLGGMATREDFLAAANAAAQPVIAGYERQAREHAFEVLKEEIVSGHWGYDFLDATEADREDGERAIRAAFAEITSIGATREKLEKIRDKALNQVKVRIQERKEKKAAAEAAERAERTRRSQTEAVTDRSLYHVDSYLRENYADWFDSVTDRWQAEGEFKADLRPVILKRLLNRKLAPEDVEAFIEEWIDDAMEEEDDEEEEDDDED